MVCDRSRVTDATYESMAKAEPTRDECGRSAGRFKFVRLSGLALFCSATVATCGQKGPLSPPEQTLAEVLPGLEVGASSTPTPLRPS